MGWADDGNTVPGEGLRGGGGGGGGGGRAVAGEATKLAEAANSEDASGLGEAAGPGAAVADLSGAGDPNVVVL